MSQGDVLAIVWIVLLVLMGPALMWLLLSRSTRTQGRVRAVTDGIEVVFRPHVPAACAGIAFLLCGLFATVGVVGSVIPSGVLYVMAALFLLVLVRALGTLLRKPRVLLSRDGMDYRGWGADAYLAWEDVAGVDSDVSNGFRPFIEVLATPPAPSFRYRRAVVALPEPKGPRPAIRILARGLDEPWRLMVYVEQMVAEAPEGRVVRLGAWGLGWLDGTLVR